MLSTLSNTASFHRGAIGLVSVECSAMLADSVRSFHTRPRTSSQRPHPLGSLVSRMPSSLLAHAFYPLENAPTWRCGCSCCSATLLRLGYERAVLWCTLIGRGHSSDVPAKECDEAIIYVAEGAKEEEKKIVVICGLFIRFEGTVMTRGGEREDSRRPWCGRCEFWSE